MTTTIRFPLLAAGLGGPAERSQVITLLSAVTVLEAGGGVAGVYTSLAPWKINANRAASPFPCVVVEFEGLASTLGDGVVPIGLFGEIIDTGVTPNVSFKTLLGILGVNIAGTNVPVIPLDFASGQLIGYSQIVSNVACYDLLSVGGVGADIPVIGDDVLTVRVRPIHQRAWVG